MLEDLTQHELDTLAELLTISHKIKAREALCIKIGITYYKEFGFINESSDSSFAINLINHLNEVGNTEAICKLCCKELLPIFQGSHESSLKEIAAKLNCNDYFKHNYSNNEQRTVPTFTSAPSVSVNPFNQLVKNTLITGGTIFLIGSVGFTLFNQNKNSNLPLAQTTPQTTPKASLPELEYRYTTLLFGYQISRSRFNEIKDIVEQHLGGPITKGVIYDNNHKPNWLSTDKSIIFYSDIKYKKFADHLAEDLKDRTGILFKVQSLSSVGEHAVINPSNPWDISIHIVE